MHAALMLGWPATTRAAVTIWFIGGLTTYSSFNYETMRLFEEVALVNAAVNVAFTLVGGFAAGWLGLPSGWMSAAGFGRAGNAVRDAAVVADPREATSRSFDLILDDARAAAAAATPVSCRDDCRRSAARHRAARRRADHAAYIAPTSLPSVRQRYPGSEARP